MHNIQNVIYMSANVSCSQKVCEYMIQSQLSHTASWWEEKDDNFQVAGQTYCSSCETAWGSQEPRNTLYRHKYS